MTAIEIIGVGRIKEKFWRDAIAEYSKRLSRYCRLIITEVADEKTPEQASDLENEQIKLKEADRILRKMDSDALVIALAIEGKKYDSISFSKLIESAGVHGKSHLQFIIGGSLGIHESILKKADVLVSFSDMTFPHQLMRCILLEQIYRSYRIMNGEPYHK